MIIEEQMSRLAEYGEIPISFEVHSLFLVEGDNPDSAKLVEVAVKHPWIKDYDSTEKEPTRWDKRWNVTNWGLLIVYIDNRQVAGCVLAHNTNGINKLEGRDDLACLWDLRVHPAYRGKGIGHRLFRAAMQWAKDRKCRELKIETQNINVPACRFYKRQGCRLSSIKRFAYDAFPDEIELIWSIAL